MSRQKEKKKEEFEFKTNPVSNDEIKKIVKLIKNDQKNTQQTKLCDLDHINEITEYKAN